MHAALERRLRQALDGREDVRVTTAESCTGGTIASRITSQPGSSAYFVGGVISYANDVKERVLGVPASVLVNPGAVSEPCARAMARGICDLLDATHAVST
ncbi:MAG: CinA family protein, partial [Chloroflexota bacterium]|nr:CinA family protein [Chloroflexota bacterium]